MIMLNQTSRFLLLAVAGLTLSTSLSAGPAPWYIWRSKIDGARVCHQTPLGPGWEQESGPYKDSHCEKLVRAQ